MSTEATLQPISRELSPQQATEIAATYAVQRLPSVLPSAEEAIMLIPAATEKTILALKGQYVTLPTSSSQEETGRHVLHAMRQMGGIEAIVHNALSSKSNTKKMQSEVEDFRVSVWDLLVSHQYTQIDQQALLEEAHPQSGLSLRQHHTHAAADAVARHRALLIQATTYSSGQITMQLEKARAGNPYITEDEIRISRAQRDLKGGIDPDKHPEAYASYQTHLPRLINALDTGDLTTLDTKETQLVRKHLSSIQALARERAQEVVRRNVQDLVQTIVNREPYVIQQTYWENILRKAAGKLAEIPLAEQVQYLEQFIADHMRKYMRSARHAELRPSEDQWVTRISDSQLNKLLAAKGLGSNGLPLTYDMLHAQLAQEHVLIPDMATMLEINTRLSKPNLNAVMVLCPDYTRDHHGTQIVYRFDGLNGGVGLVGEVGLPVVLPLAERIVHIRESSPQTTDIPTFHLRYADIEATEGNIASTKVGTKEQFLSRLDQSADTLTREVTKHFNGSYHVVRIDEPGELLHERTLVVQDAQGRQLVRFKIGALTAMLAEPSAVLPSQQFAEQTTQIRKEGLRLLREGSAPFINDLDNALTERLPIVMKLQWDDMESMQGAQALHEITTLHIALSKNTFQEPVNARQFSRGIAPLINQINDLITTTDEKLTPRTINKFILDWLKSNMPDTLTVLRTKHITQLAEYIAVCRGIDRTFGTSAVQIVGDSLVMNQKAARGTKVQQLLIKGRWQYGGNVAEEELAEA